MHLLLVDQPGCVVFPSVFFFYFWQTTLHAANYARGSLPSHTREPADSVRETVTMSSGDACAQREWRFSRRSSVVAAHDPRSSPPLLQQRVFAVNLPCDITAPLSSPLPRPPDHPSKKKEKQSTVPFAVDGEPQENFSHRSPSLCRRKRMELASPTCSELEEAAESWPPLFEAARSGLPNSNLGLVAKEAIPASTILGVYTGALLSQSDLDAKYGAGRKTLAPRAVLATDPDSPTGELFYVDPVGFRRNKLQYGNDCHLGDVLARRCPGTNAELVYRPDATAGSPTGGCVVVRTTEKISPGQEIFVDYGSDYWDDHTDEAATNPGNGSKEAPMEVDSGGEGAPTRVPAESVKTQWMRRGLSATAAAARGRESSGSAFVAPESTSMRVCRRLWSSEVERLEQLGQWCTEEIQDELARVPSEPSPQHPLVRRTVDAWRLRRGGGKSNRPGHADDEHEEGALYGDDELVFTGVGERPSPSSAGRWQLLGTRSVYSLNPEAAAPGAEPRDSGGRGRSRGRAVRNSAQGRVHQVRVGSSVRRALQLLEQWVPPEGVPRGGMVALRELVSGSTMPRLSDTERLELAHHLVASGNDARGQPALEEPFDVRALVQLAEVGVVTPEDLVAAAIDRGFPELAERFLRRWWWVNPGPEDKRPPLGLQTALATVRLITRRGPRWSETAHAVAAALDRSAGWSGYAPWVEATATLLRPPVEEPQDAVTRRHGLPDPLAARMRRYDRQLEDIRKTFFCASRTRLGDMHPLCDSARFRAAVDEVRRRPVHSAGGPYATRLSSKT